MRTVAFGESAINLGNLRPLHLRRAMAAILPLAVYASFVFPTTIFLPLNAQTANYAGDQTLVDDNTMNPNVGEPLAVAVDGLFNVYVLASGSVTVEAPKAGSGGYTSRKVNSSLQVAQLTPGTLAVDFNMNLFVGAVTVTDVGSVLTVLELQRDTYGTALPIVSTNTAGTVPYSVAADHSTIYVVAPTLGGKMLTLAPDLMSASGYAQSTTSTGLPNLQAVATDPRGNIYLATNTGGAYLRVFGCSSPCTNTQVLPEGSLPGPFSPGNLSSFPLAMATDGARTLYIASTENSYTSVVQVKSPGAPQTLVGYGLRNAAGVAVDSSNNVFIADTGNSRVVKVSFGPVDFGLLAVGTTSPTPQSIHFVFDSPGVLGGTFVSATGTTPLAVFNDTRTGSCKAGEAYKRFDVCTIDVTCTPPIASSFTGSAALVNSSGQQIASEGMICNGKPAPPPVLAYVCFQSDYCGASIGGLLPGVNGEGSTNPFGQGHGPPGNQGSIIVSNRPTGGSCGPGHNAVFHEVCTPVVLNVEDNGPHTEMKANGKLEPGRILKFEGESRILFTAEPTAGSAHAESAHNLSIQGVEVSAVTPTSATVSWKTGTPTHSGVIYQEENGARNLTPNAADSITEPSFRLENLKPGTLYHLTLWSNTDIQVVSSALSVTTPSK